MSGAQNVAALRRLIEEGFGRGDLQVVDETVDPAVVEHQPGIEPPNADGVKRAIRFLHTAFPDMRVEIKHEVADGDLAWCHFTARGTHLGPFGRIPPTRKSYEIDVIDIARFKDGRIVEHWGVPDRFSQLEQLGLLSLQRAGDGVSAMYILHIEHAVPDFEGWKRAFDSDPVGRAQSGVRRYWISRAVDYPNRVSIDLEFASQGEADGLLAAMRKVWARVEGQIMMNPRAEIAKVVETHQY